MEAVEEKRGKILGPGRMKASEFANTNYTVVVENDTTFEDIQKIEFWSTHAYKMRNLDRVTIVPDDTTWLADALVLQAGKNWARVRILNSYRLDAEKSGTETDPHYVEWKGPHRKWEVIRRQDGEVIKSELQSREDAQLYMREHEKL